jgi:hypothetical protein
MYRPSLLATHVEIDSCELRFETDCPAAMQRLNDVCAATFSGCYYTYSVSLQDSGRGLPTFRYLDRDAYSTRYQERETLLTFEAPWSDIGGTTLMAAWLHFLCELVRQRRGEYLLHASVVAREGRAIVLFGPGESGKTICALDLCLRHGFRFFANNRVRAAVRDGGVHLLKGDASLNLRFSSLRRYSEPLCRSVFLAPPKVESAQHKQVVDPLSIGIQVAPPAPRIVAFIWIKLDADGRNTAIRQLSPATSSGEAFWAKADLYQEMSGLIRGVRFIPIVEGLEFKPIFVPSLDRPEFVARRVAFLNTLFATAGAALVRAPLSRSVDAIVRLFEKAGGPAPA